MKKIFILGLTIFVLSFVFISCDNGTNGGDGGGSGYDNVPSVLIGTWVGELSWTDTTYVFKTNTIERTNSFGTGSLVNLTVVPYTYNHSDSNGGSNLSSEYPSGYKITGSASSGSVLSVLYICLNSDKTKFCLLNSQNGIFTKQP